MKNSGIISSMPEKDLFLQIPDQDRETGEFCYQLAQELFPICRSLTGPGVRETLTRIQGHLPGLY